MQCFNYFSFCTPLIMEPTVRINVVWELTIPGAKGPPHLKLIFVVAGSQRSQPVYLLSLTEAKSPTDSHHPPAAY
jgi:hypothetical protein